MLKTLVYIVYSADGKQIAAASGRSQSGAYTVMEIDARTGERRKILEAKGKPADALAFSSNGNTIVLAVDGGIFRKNISTEEYLRDWSVSEDERVIGFAFMGDDTTLVAADSKGRVAIHAADGRLLRKKELSYPIDAFAVSTRLQRIVIGGGEHRITILSWPDWQTVVQTDDAHSDDIFRLAFSPDGQFLASAGKDRQVILWNARNFEKLIGFRLGGTDWGDLAFSQSSSYLALAGPDDLVTLWDLRFVQDELARIGLGWSTLKR